MWFEPPPAQPDWKPAIRHLRRIDPLMRPAIDAVGPCTLAPRRDYFVVLCKAIFTQQISTKVAAVLFSRFRDLFPLRRPTPGRTIDLLKKPAVATATMRACGLSRQKASYLL